MKRCEGSGKKDLVHDTKSDIGKGLSTEEKKCGRQLTRAE
jgi:hypothetical protein